MAEKLIPLPRAAAEFATMGYVPAISYLQFYKAILNNKIPSERVNGRIFLRPDEIAEIANTLELTRTSTTAAARPRRRA